MSKLKITSKDVEIHISFETYMNLRNLAEEDGFTIEEEISDITRKEKLLREFEELQNGRI